MRLADLSENQAINSLVGLSKRLQECQSAWDSMRWIRQSVEQAYGPAALMMVGTRGLPRSAYLVLRLCLDDARWSDDSRSSCLAQPPLYRDGIIARIINTPEPKLIDGIDWSGDPYFHEILAGFGSVMAIPVTGENLQTTWVMLLKRSPDRFTTQDLEAAMLRSVLAAPLIKSQKIQAELTRTNGLIEAEMLEVGKLQRSLLPNPRPEIPGLEWAASYKPSGRAGGDVYDIFPLDTADLSGPWCIFVGDASGHGIAAAVVIAMIHSILRAHPSSIDGPAGLLGYVNRHLCRKNLTGFVTAFLAFYEPRAKHLTYASAGHPPALIRPSANGRVERLRQVGGYPLGIDNCQRFTQTSLQLREEDALLIYTDGITEARGHDEELFDIGRLEFAFAGADGKPSEIIHRLCKLIEDYQPNAKPSDDQTMVVIQMITGRKNTVPIKVRETVGHERETCGAG